MEAGRGEIAEGLYNRERALERVAGEEDLLEELIISFQEEYPRWLEGIETALEEDDAGEVRRLAHTIKGSAAILEAEPTTTLARELEELASRGRLEKVEESLPLLREALRALLG